MKRFISVILTLIVALSTIVPSFAELIDADEAARQATQNVKKYETQLQNEEENPLVLNSKFALAIDMNDGTVLFEQKPDTKIQIASMTKIMTALVAIEHIDNISDSFVITADMVKEVTADESVAGFWIGETVTYEDLLYGILLPSGADAVYAIANKVAGSSKEFVAMMNDKAKQLGLKNTHFSNAVGLDSSKNYSTVRDVATIFREALKNETFYKIDTTMKYTTSGGSHTFTSTIYDSIKAMGTNLDYLLGGKTGTTSGAGLCLASIAKQGDAYIMLVTANAEVGSTPYNVKDARTVYEYFFNNYSYSTIKKAGDTVYSLPTYLCKDEKYNISAPADIVKYLPVEYDESKVKISYSGKKQVRYDMKSGTSLGTVTISYDDNIIYSQKVALSSDMHFSLGAWIKLHPLLFTLIIFAVLAVLAIAVLLTLMGITGNLKMPKFNFPAKRKKPNSRRSNNNRSKMRTQNKPHKPAKSKLNFNKNASKHDAYEELKRQKQRESHDWYDF